MQRNVRKGGLLFSLGLLLAVCPISACRAEGDTAPATATAELELSRARIAQGSPVDLTYRFTVAETPDPAGTYRVFSHVLDADEELMWTDDHEPAVPPASWQPGQVIEYRRTMWVPMYPYVGTAKVILGVYDVKTNARLKLGNADRGDRSYQLAEFELLPQTESVYLIFKDGWHPAEVAADNPAVQWQWTRKEATLAFRNPKRDAMLLLQLDNPSTSPNAATTVDVRLGETSLGALPVNGGNAGLHRLDLPAEALGTGDMAEITLVADRTFVPAREAGSNSGDPRELGVRVFHAYVMPK